MKSLSDDDYVLEVNGWLVKIMRDAYISERKFIEKYGKNRVPLAEAWIEGFNYSICSPILTAEELLQLIRDMKPITRGI